MCAIKTAFLKISQHSHGNTRGRASFLIKLQASGCNFIKKETPAQVFSCECCEIFKNTFFIKQLLRLLCWQIEHLCNIKTQTHSHMFFCPILFVYNYKMFKKSGTVFSLALMFYARFMERSNEAKTKQKYQTKQKKKWQQSKTVPVSKNRNVNTSLERKSFLCIYTCYHFCNILTSEISHAFIL